MSDLFVPLDDHPAYRQIANLIEQRIVERTLRTGDALPSETDLARQFGVNRSTIREAIRELEVHGLLGRERGEKRLRVTRPEPRRVSSGVSRALALHDVTFMELWEAMMAIEPAAAEYAAEDLRVAMDYARSLPNVDPDRAIAVGVSTGGLATVALTANAPRELVAAINFAGGRGSQADHDVCNPDDLVHAYKDFGKHSRVPMLWLYAQNDKFFWPELAQKFDAAFRSQGGNDQFVLAPPIGDDGHSLFRHVDAWSDTVDAFLIAHQLNPLPQPFPEIPPPNVPPPPGLSENGQHAFESYLLLGPHKAFAT